MKKLIKQIREYVGLSQNEMANKICIELQKLRNFENGTSKLTCLELNKLFDFCECYNIPVYDMLIEKIKNEVESIKLEKGRILLYHGSKSGLVGEIAPISREKCDFGKGFYMGTSIEQPLTLICDFEKSKFYVVSIDIKDLEIAEIPADIDWALIVAYYRGKMKKIKGSKFYNKYSNRICGKDLIIGNIANDRMFFVIDNFFLENITDVALVKSLSALRLGKQYVAITEKACKAIKVEKEIKLSYFERKVLQKISEINRQKGINLANEICKTYRREGQYFDEILNKGLKEEEKWML